MTDSFTACFDLRVQLEDILRLLTTMVHTLSLQNKAGKALKTGSLERCEHNIVLIKEAISEVTHKINLLQKTASSSLQMTECLPLKKIIHDLQEEGKWQPGVFLQTLKERLHTIENELEANLIEPVKAQSPTINAKPSAKTVRDNTAADAVTVYMHLYQATGKVLSTWLPLFQNLRSLVQSRPIYANEADVLSVLEARGQAATDAYLMLAIPKAILVHPFRGRQHIDKYGHELLVIDSDRFPARPHIGYFYHQGKRYHLVDGELVLI
ncbi:MAG: icmQ [Gammaproteobacteria bacterium]|jgi:intracellular multiplication protein IcmQ|nr:icmQ [Gammaproteobacteria bacterium]